MAAFGIPFRKMHGLGNDFVVVDTRTRPLALCAGRVRALADRRTGVGCDQVVTIEAPRSDHPGSAAFMGIRNADGGVVEACGNATRCVGRLLMDEAGVDHVIIGTLAGPVTAERDGPHGLIRVDMGPARPGGEPASPLHVDLGVAPFADAVAVTVGNPHVVALVDDAEAVDLAAVGPVVEHHPMFPARVNAEVVCRLEGAATPTLRMRVWERGAGITRACGTGACAAVVAAVVRGLVPRGPVTVRLDGGDLHIDWRTADDHALMTGPATLVFSGTLEEAWLS